MGRKETVISNLKRFKEKLKKDFPLNSLVLFGSIAEGNDTRDSDVDLILVSEKFSDLNFIKRAAKMYDYWTLKMPVDFLCYTPKEFSRLKKQVSIVSYALKHGIVI